MTSEESALLHEIVDGQRRLLAALDHALAGPPGDKGPRKGWLRELLAVVTLHNNPPMRSVLASVNLMSREHTG